jgi:membrane associated rhomboid family serine protease
MTGVNTRPSSSESPGELANWMAFQLIRRFGLKVVDGLCPEAYHVLEGRSRFFVILDGNKAEAELQNTKQEWSEFAKQRASKVGAHLQLLFLLDKNPDSSLRKAIDSRVAPRFSTVSVHSAWVDDKGWLGGNVPWGSKDLKTLLAQFREGGRSRASLRETLELEPLLMERQQLFFPWLHVLIITISAIFNVWATRHDFSSVTLLNQGAYCHPLIVAGQWWRVATFGSVHLFSAHFWGNLVTLCFFGIMLERRIGTLACSLIYAWSAVSAALVVATLSLLLPFSTISGGTSVYIFGGLGGGLHLLSLYRGRVPYEAYRQFRFPFWLFLPSLVPLLIADPQESISLVMITILHAGALVGGWLAAQWLRVEEGGRLGFRPGGQAVAIITALAYFGMLGLGLERSVRLDPLDYPTRSVAFSKDGPELQLPVFFQPSLFGKGAYNFGPDSLLILRRTNVSLEDVATRVVDPPWTLRRVADESGWVRWRVEHPTKRPAAWVIASSRDDGTLVIQIWMPEREKAYVESLLRQCQGELPSGL